jgi:hypothetical protein
MSSEGSATAVFSPPRPSRMATTGGRGIGALAAAGAALTWLWVCWCLFPVSPWNDLRLAPAFAWRQGLPVYPGENWGAVSTWIYGPLPLLLWLPATLAKSAATAVLAAGTINLLSTVVALAAVCAFWPVQPAQVTWRERTLAWALAVALWPRAAFQFLQADNVAIALALVGSLVLVRSDRPRARWTAAALAMAGLACKQTSIGAPLAQVLWLGMTIGRRESIRHLLRCATIGLSLGLAAIAVFGWEGLRLNLLTVPMHLPPAPDPWSRLADLAPELAVQLFLPAIAIGVLWRKRATVPAPLLLPALAWIGAALPGVAALFTVGGNLNSLQGFCIWLPPMLVAAFAHVQNRRTILFGAGVLAVLAICGARVFRIPSVSFHPLTAHYDQGMAMAEAHKGHIWFPWNPLITLYSEQRLYHVEDGLCMRLYTGHGPNPEHVRKYLPPEMAALALPRGGADWGIAVRLLPAGSSVEDVGFWTLHRPPSGIPAHTLR